MQAILTTLSWLETIEARRFGSNLLGSSAKLPAQAGLLKRPTSMAAAGCVLGVLAARLQTHDRLIALAA